MKTNPINRARAEKARREQDAIYKAILNPQPPEPEPEQKPAARSHSERLANRLRSEAVRLSDGRYRRPSR